MRDLNCVERPRTSLGNCPLLPDGQGCRKTVRFGIRPQQELEAMAVLMDAKHQDNR